MGTSKRTSWNRAARNRIERVVKGFASHRRIEILTILDATPNLDISELAIRCRAGFPAVAEHVRKMTVAGLIEKERDGVSIRLRLTERGEAALRMIHQLGCA